MLLKNHKICITSAILREMHTIIRHYFLPIRSKKFKKFITLGFGRVWGSRNSLLGI